MPPEKRKRTSTLTTIPIVYPTRLPRQTNAAVAANKAMKTRKMGSPVRSANTPKTAAMTIEDTNGTAISGARLETGARDLLSKP